MQIYAVTVKWAEILLQFDMQNFRKIKMQTIFYYYLIEVYSWKKKFAFISNVYSWNNSNLKKKTIAS